MKVRYSNNFIEKLNKKKMPVNERKRIIRKVKTICESAADKNELDAIMKTWNGKKLEGARDENTFKFQLNDGDRIVYTYSKNIHNMREKDAVVLIDIITHDKQNNYNKSAEFMRFSDKAVFTESDDIEVVSAQELCSAILTIFVLKSLGSGIHEEFIMKPS